MRLSSYYWGTNSENYSNARKPAKYGGFQSVRKLLNNFQTLFLAFCDGLLKMDCKRKNAAQTVWPNFVSLIHYRTGDENDAESQIN